MHAADKEHKPSVSETYKLGVHLDNASRLELRYSCTTLGKADLSIEYAGGQIKVFEADRFLLERLLEQLEDQ